MRLYTFTNMYLSSIQCGIQTAHVVSELFKIYDKIDDELKTMLHTWAKDHKTICILNGGPSKQLDSIAATVCDAALELKYPWTYFCEDGVNNSITCTGVILPDSVYMWKSVEDYVVGTGDGDKTNLYTAINGSGSPKAKLIHLIRTCGLAR